MNGMDFITKNIAIQEKTFPHLCIDPFGSIILAQSPLDITSIIKTGIQEIIRSKIFNVYRRLFICPMLAKKTNGLEVKGINNSLLKPRKKLRYGMQAQKAENGIENMVNKLGRKGKKFLKNVWNVGRNIRVGSLIQNIAIQIVNTVRDLSLVSITRIGNAQFVKNGLWFTSMPKRERVVKIVPQNLQESQKVYDFEVEDDHCYYANGILVSNSDAFRMMAVGLNKVERSNTSYDPRTLGSINSISNYPGKESEHFLGVKSLKNTCYFSRKKP